MQSRKTWSKLIFGRTSGLAGDSWCSSHEIKRIRKSNHRNKNTKIPRVWNTLLKINGWNLKNPLRLRRKIIWTKSTVFRGFRVASSWVIFHHDTCSAEIHQNFTYRSGFRPWKSQKKTIRISTRKTYPAFCDDCHVPCMSTTKKTCGKKT